MILRLWKGGAITELSTSASAMKAGTWSHVVATWNGSTMVIYVNGVQRAAPTRRADRQRERQPVHGLELWLLGWLNTGLDEVAIFGSALSSARVQAHYAAADVPPAVPAVALDTPASNSTMDVRGAEAQSALRRL